MELFFAMIAWIFGILSGLYFKISIVFFIVFILGLYALKNKNRYLKVLYSKRILFIIILCYIISYFQIIHLEKSFEERYKCIESEQEINVVGTIISNPVEKEYKTVYTIKVQSINGDTSYKNTKLLLNVKKGKKQKQYKCGNQILFVGTFKETTLQRNTGGFDYKQYLKTKNIYGTIVSEVDKIKVIKDNNINLILKLANVVANKIQEKSEELLDQRCASMLTGILIGNRDKIEEDIEESFRKSNLTHMLAVSGQHVSYVIIGISFIVSNLKVGKKNGKVLSIILILFFMLITGNSASVQRACFMSVYMIIASLFHKRITIFSSISISMLILMILNPYCIFDIGLQLSYGGTVGIVVLYKMLNKYFKKKDKIKNKIEDQKIETKNYFYKVKISIKEMIHITLSANIILIPIMLYHFNTLSFTFLISNLLASPIMGVIVLLGFVTLISSFIFHPFGKILSIILEILIKIFLKIAEVTGNLPLSQIIIATPKLQWIIVYYIAIFLFVYYQKIKEKKVKRNIEKKILTRVKKINIKNAIVILIIITTLILVYNKLLSNNLKIYFIDVGQGDSTLIVSPNKKTILIDGGGSKEKEVFDVGEKTLIPYLLDRGITKLDYVLISHFDADHVGGILSVLEKLKVEKVMINKQGESSENYEEFKRIVKEKKIKVLIVKKGDNILIDRNVSLKILWPKEKQIKENILNNNSIVAKLRYNKFSILFTGDIEEVAEKQILEEYKNTNMLSVDILKVAHHGSKSSTIQSFLEKVKPKIALIGVGKDNTFGHPNDGVLERLEKIGTKIYRTDENGEINIFVDKKGRIKLEKFIE